MPGLLVTTAILITLGLVVFFIWAMLFGNFLSPVQATNDRTVIQNCCGDRSKWDCVDGTQASVMCRTPTGTESLQNLATDAGITDYGELCRLCFCTGCPPP